MRFKEKRKNKRVADILGLNMEAENRAECSVTLSGTFVGNLSIEGVAFSCESKLPEGALFHFGLKLTSLPDALKLRAQVAGCTENKSSNSGKFYSIRMTFLDTDEVTRKHLENHIDHIICQTSVIRELPYRQIA